MSQRFGPSDTCFYGHHEECPMPTCCECECHARHGDAEKPVLSPPPPTSGGEHPQLRARWKGQQWEVTGQPFWDHCEFRLVNGDITMLVDITEPPEGWEWIL